MKYLKVDEQTLSDLSILGKQGKASVYALFNRTRTQGGAALLNELFKLPLADETEINRRAGIYQFFSQQEFEFPVESEVIGMLNHYLKNDDVRTQIQLGKQHIGQRFRDMVATDAEVNFINDGVQAALRLFSKLLAFLEKWKTIAVKGPGEQIFGQLEKLIQDNAFTPLHPYTKNAREARLSHIQLSELDKLIRFEEREKMLELLQLLFELDVFIAVGKVTRAQGFHFAKAMPSGTGTLHYQQVYHPHVEGAIANDLHLNASQNILFLTGANMAGKSTLMKSIGIALYLAHMGFPVAAKQFEFSVRDGIYTSINLSDNLSMGASHYYAEVLRVKEVAVELSMGKQLFVIFDELFRGTNVKDAHDATIALTRAFSNKKGSQFIISTHIMEAGEILQQQALSIKFQYLPTVMKGNTPQYTRVLKDGITADRQGMVIIQNEGILEMLDKGLHQNKEVLCHS